MSDNELFKFNMLCTDTSGGLQIVSTRMPDADDDYDTTRNYGTVKYFSNEDVLERLSRVMYMTFIKAAKLKFTSSYTFTNTYTSSGFIDFMISSVSSVYKDFSVGPSSTKKVVDVKLVIHELLLSNTDFSSNEDSYSSSYTGPVTIKLKNSAADGDEIVVLALRSASLFKNTNKPSLWANNNKLVLTEESFRSINDGFDGTLTSKAFEHYLPTETMISLNGSSLGSNWRVTLETSTAVFGRLRFGLEVQTVETGFPLTAPVVSIDTDTKIILGYDEKFVTNNIVFGFTPRLKTMIDFGNSNMRYNSTYGVYDLIFPNYALQNNGSLVTLKQNNSTRSYLCNLTRIIISSSSIPADPEYGASRTTSNVLSDFVIETDVDSLGVLQYSETAGVHPWRRYRLRSNIAFSHFDIDICNLFEMNPCSIKVNS